MEIKDAIPALSALAQETRLAIFRLLVEAGPGGRRAGLIAAALELPNPTLSFHLAQLRQAGLVTAQRDGRQIIYAADYTCMNDLIEFLTANCCQGSMECELSVELPAIPDGADTQRTSGGAS
jgi:DNA-binding transcriptional ArsR family regulator